MKSNSIPVHIGGSSKALFVCLFSFFFFFGICVAVGVDGDVCIDQFTGYFSQIFDETAMLVLITLLKSVIVFNGIIFSRLLHLFLSILSAAASFHIS